jgi:hypothetical protein
MMSMPPRRGGGPSATAPRSFGPPTVFRGALSPQAAGGSRAAAHRGHRGLTVRSGGGGGGGSGQGGQGRQGGPVGGGGGGAGAVDFLSRQQHRQQQRAARLEARRESVHRERMSRPVFRPVTAGHDVMNRPTPSSLARPGGGAGPEYGRAGRGSHQPARPSTDSGGSRRSKAKSSSSSGGGARHPMSAAAAKEKEQTMGQALALMRAYVKLDSSGRCEEALDAFRKAVPAGARRGEDKKPRKRQPRGALVSQALGTLANYVSQNEDYGTSAFRELGNMLPFAAAMGNDAELLRYFERAGIQLDALARPGDGATPLLLAAGADHAEACEALLAAGEPAAARGLGARARPAPPDRS